MLRRSTKADADGGEMRGDAQVATIHLVRHLPTERLPSTRIDRHALQGWCDSLDARGIDPEAQASAELVDLIGHSRHLVVSPLARAQATARVIVEALPPHGRPEVRTLDNLREAPYPVLPVPRVRVTLDVWGVLCRTAWLLGYSREVESRRAAVIRAERVAQELCDLAPSGTVTVIGHGVFNALIGRELRRRDWLGPRIPSGRNGAVSSYRGIMR